MDRRKLSASLAGFRIDSQNFRDLCVFAALVAFACVGRWDENRPWEFTPLAAVAVFAGYYFDRFGIALLVPLAARAITDAGLSPHDNLAVVFCVYAFAVVPVAMGRLIRRRSVNPHTPRSSTAVSWIAAGIVPAVTFFVTTNFAVWAFKSLYPPTWSGLAACYWNAIPFFRSMLLGDLFFLAVLFGCYAASRAWSTNAARRTVS